MPLERIVSRAALLTEHLGKFRLWCQWRKARHEALDIGLKPLVLALEQGRITPEQAEPVFQRGDCQWWGFPSASLAFPKALALVIACIAWTIGGFVSQAPSAPAWIHLRAGTFTFLADTGRFTALAPLGAKGGDSDWYGDSRR